TANFESAVDDTLCGGLLAVDENLVYQLSNLLRVVNWVFDDGTLWSSILTHFLLLSLLCAVTGTGLLTVLDTLGIQRTTDDLVANTRKVFHTTTANKHHGVLLQVVALTWDVCGNLNTGGQAHTGNLTQSGVRLLWISGVDAGAIAPSLG